MRCVCTYVRLAADQCYLNFPIWHANSMHSNSLFASLLLCISGISCERHLQQKIKEINKINITNVKCM